MADRQPTRTMKGRRVEYRLDGELHREDGPAVEWPDVAREWWVKGQRHREDGPAVEHANGTREWYWNGVLHRDDGGPVRERPGHFEEWSRDGKLHRDGDEPARIYADGSRQWWKDGELHREGGPAVIQADGRREWWQHDVLHREDGPAVEPGPGEPREWWLNGEQITERDVATYQREEVARRIAETRAERNASARARGSRRLRELLQEPAAGDAARPKLADVESPAPSITRATEPTHSLER